MFKADYCGGVTAKQFSSVWTREPRQTKAPGRSREDIVAATIELLDAEGLDGLSMRKLGAKLSAGATSLYWYVSNKEELLELAYDEIWGEISFPDPDQNRWMVTAAAFAREMRRVMLRHPWSTGLIGHMPAFGPNSMAIANELTRTFTSAGFRGLELDYAIASVMAYVMGMAIGDVAHQSAFSAGRYGDLATLKDTAAKAAADYPAVVERIETTYSADMDQAREMSFDYGLFALLDGLKARLV